MTWADAVDVKALTGAVVTDALIDQATAVIELTGGGRLAKLDPAYVSERNLDWLRRAVCYQAAFMADQPDYFARMDVSSLNQDGIQATLKGDSLILAPLARRCLKRLSWRGVRTITPSINRTTDRPGYRTSNAPDLPDVPSSGGFGGFGASLMDDELPWGPM
jgi:hypothetical protein